MTDSLILKVTDAGRAALVNAQNNGTDAVLIAAIGVTDQAFTADESTAALPGELKRLTTFAGSAVAADTIHVSIRDDSADVYSLRGFALYLDDGTLFASYGQADPIGEKSAQSMLLLALDIIFADIDATTLTFGDTNFLLASATTEVQGIVELATEAEAETGTDATRAMTPATHKGATDARFGAAAPSTFVKSLLAAASAVALRAALALKGAALYDTGTGNGLDADKLDGQHGSYYRAWANLTDVPTSFPPSAHQHAWTDITGAPAQATRWATWDEVTDKPTTFTPAPHSQDWSTINNKPATAIRWPAWGEVTGKPVFMAVATSGNYNDLSNLPDLSVYMQKTGGTFVGSTAVSKGWSGPAGNPSTMAFYTSGSWGGGIGIIDGPYGIGFYSESGVLQFALGSSTSISVKATMDAAGNFSCNGTVASPGFTSSASSRTVKHDIAPCRYGLAEFLQIPWVEYRYDKEITEDNRLRFGSLVEGDGVTPGVEDFASELVIRREGQVPTFEYDQFIPVLGRALQQYIAVNDARLANAEARAENLGRELAVAITRIDALENHSQDRR